MRKNPNSNSAYKWIVLYASLIVIITLLGGTLYLNLTDSKTTDYALIEIETLPEGWTEAKFHNYFYHVDTKIVYFGKSSQIKPNYVQELKSKEYANYVYDAETNEFIGINRFSSQ